MQALTFSSASGKATLEQGRPIPVPGPGEVLVKVLRAGICSTDLEICRGYVPGFHGVLGHEFVGVVAAQGPPLEAPAATTANGDAGLQGGPSQEPLAIGMRVVGEINCNDTHFTCADAIFQRNHAPGRTVLGIIGRDGCLAPYVTLPAACLHAVPPALADQEAVFAEPLAAACRIPEQGLPRRPESDRVAVIGDGKLGLLVAQVLVRTVEAAGGPPLVMLGRHTDKMALVQGQAERVVLDGSDSPPLLERLAGSFDLVVEASGSAAGIRTALALCRPLGTILLKSTVSTTQHTQQQSDQQQAEEGAEKLQTADGNCTTQHAKGEGAATATASSCCAAPLWAEIANDIVVNEKVLVGSRCGPFDVALGLMERDAAVRQLLRYMISAELPLERGEEALALAATRGVLKVQLVMPE
ncbi:hypothetical protein Agub_g11722 [Astrephomene gubernaculifera]|uniref:Alcohol dehydrogenase-like N-terminal domain-containing protein n=1 Tax=Astrephomene gubernaculifera TaxID=47775 RepID=A0AAD3DXN3_9CHLO|nr:hypothetical protein Agub_g11722 [Astrephomene gubernaculifera]